MFMLPEGRRFFEWRHQLWDTLSSLLFTESVWSGFRLTKLRANGTDTLVEKDKPHIASGKILCAPMLPNQRSSRLFVFL
jgi:hypothetical protein